MACQASSRSYKGSSAKAYNKNQYPGPPWRNDGSKRLGKQAEATLESIYSRTRWPDDKVIEGIWDLHKIPKTKVIEWFRSRRSLESGTSSIKEKVVPKESGTDWDADWGASPSEQQK